MVPSTSNEGNQCLLAISGHARCSHVRTSRVLPHLRRRSLILLTPRNENFCFSVDTLFHYLTPGCNTRRFCSTRLTCSSASVASIVDSGVERGTIPGFADDFQRAQVPSSNRDPFQFRINSERVPIRSI